MKWVRCFLICCLSLFVISCDKETAMQPREEVSLKPDKSYVYEKIQKPELAFSKDMKQMYLIEVKRCHISFFACGLPEKILIWSVGGRKIRNG